MKLYINVMTLILLVMMSSSVPAEVIDFFKRSKIVRCYVVPVIHPRMVNDDVLGNTEPNISPVAGRNIAHIVNKVDLELIRSSVLEKKFYDKSKKGKRRQYEIIFLFENGLYISGYLVFVGKSAYIDFLPKKDTEKGLYYLAISKKAMEAIVKDMLPVVKNKNE